MMLRGRVGSEEWATPDNWVVGGSSGHHASKAATVILAGALALGVFILTPRPHVFLSNGRFSLSNCDLSTSSQVVRATFTLTNTGHVDGFADVHLNVDGTSATVNEFGVQAGASIPGELTSQLPDCGSHSYSLLLCIPYGGRGSYC